MSAPSKSNFSRPWAFASGTSLEPVPRWWNKRNALQNLFQQLLDQDGYPDATQHQLWAQGVSIRHIFEFFCLVARYGQQQVFNHYFS